MTARFAVVGRSNKGKSSVVATLTENDRVLIAPAPRTTKVCQEFRLEVDGVHLFSIIDTPGFEEAAAALEWLTAEQPAAHQRRERVAAFVDTFKKTGHFQYECELLQPILDGAAIIYVADGSHPYRPNYENELEILRWTGAPSLAVINPIHGEDYIAEWQAALNQYFRKTKVFDAHRSYFEDRLALLNDLRTLDAELDSKLDESIDLLTTQHAQRIRSAADAIAALTLDAAGHTLNAPHHGRRATRDEKKRLENKYQDQLRSMEGRTRQRIARLFNYHSLPAQENSLAALDFDRDLFCKETWQMFGLNRTQMVAASTALGAATGGVIDLAVGGHSMLAGTAIGGVLGGASALWLSLAEPTVKGLRISGQTFIIGPHTNPNFPWVILDRALACSKAVLTRTHAQRSPLVVAEPDSKIGPVSRLPGDIVRDIEKMYRKARKGKTTDEHQHKLAHLIEGLIRRIEKDIS